MPQQPSREKQTFGESSTYLTVIEFAEAIGKSARSVQRYVRQGRLTHARAPNGGVLIPMSELRRFARPRRVGPGETRPPTGGGLRSVQGKLSVMGSAEPGHESVEETTMDPILGRPASRASLSLNVVPLLRHEEMVLRLGWTEGQLEMTRRLLKESRAREEELRRLVEEAERRAEAEVESRLAAEARIRDLEARLRVWNAD